MHLDLLELCCKCYAQSKLHYQVTDVTVLYYVTENTETGITGFVILTLFPYYFI